MLDSLTNFGQKLNSGLADLLSAPDVEFISAPDATPILNPPVGTDDTHALPVPGPVGRPAVMPFSFSSALASAGTAVSSATSSVSNSVKSLVSKVTGTSSSASGAKTAAPGSSWMLYALLAGAAVVVFVVMRGKKGGSILSKLGGKSGVKLH